MLRRARCVLLLAAAIAWAGCSDPPPPIALEGGAIVLLNQTPHDWRNVTITVNDHYNGGVSLLRAQGRANAPLSRLQTGYMQPWVSGTPVRKIEVKAESADGTPVRLTWEGGQVTDR